MKFGINTYLFTSPFTNASTKLFRQFREWGFDSVEMAIEHPSHIDPAFVRRELDRHGLACTSLCACFGPDRDLRGTPRQQKASVKYIEALLDHMVVLGSTSLIGPVYSSVGRADAVPGPEYRKQWKTVVQHLKHLAAYAEDRNCRICVEPLNRFETDFINTCDQVLALLKAVGSPALKILLDTFHMNIEEKDPCAAIRKAGKHLGHVHACGNDRGTPGNDHTDWQAIGIALKDAGYNDLIVIESFTPDVKVIARAAAIWRRIEPTRDEIAVDGLKFLKRAFK
ncbi:MAG TPA: sugar phosphate isomerase/epimerase [Verrucomicrobiae bacterium]|nr:sugar phosphate isomerase/epimerase [Verrucomicrobiae bacterium]